MRWVQNSAHPENPDHNSILVLPSPRPGCSVTTLPLRLAEVISGSEMHRAGPLAGLVRAAGSILSSDPESTSWFEDAAIQGYAVQLVDGDHDQVFVDRAARTIDIPAGGLDAPAIARSTYFRHVFFCHLVQAIRLINQQTRIKNQNLNAAHAIIWARFRAADAAICLIDVADRLKSHAPALWRHVLGSGLGDVALAYTRVTERTPLSPLARRMGCQAGLHQWLASELRLNACDHATLEYLDRDVNALGIATKPLRPRLMTRLCESAGESYLDLAIATEWIAAPPNIPDLVNRAHFDQICREQGRTIVNNIAFSDEELARRIFPD